jgi:DNA-binding HxlR family transcriptional regulator
MMIAEGDRLGVSALRLLAEGSTIQILQELGNGPLRPIELERRLPEVAHSALMRRLNELALWGAVGRERVVDVPTRAYYSLAEPGEALLEIPEESMRWEQQWSSQPPPDTPGTWPLRLLADERARALLRALAQEPRRPADLERLPGLGRSAARRRLERLLRDDLLTRIEDGGQVRYALTACAHRLRLIAMLAARWEWRWAFSGSPVTMSTPAASPGGS